MADRLVGLREIADVYHVAPSTARVWRHRGVLPPPVAVVSGTPVWWRSQIEAWRKPE